jgi:hypothetical protein
MTRVRLEPGGGRADVHTDVGAGVAVRAWEHLCLSLGRGHVAPPTAVVRLKGQRLASRKSAVYRLEGVGDGGSAVVAKRCLQSTGRVERDVYERLLPRIPVPRLRYYGYIEEHEGSYGWLFMGDAGGAKPTMADRGVLGEWLARLHAGAALLPADVSLPDRGPGHFRALLPAARTGLGAARAVAGPQGHDCRALEYLGEALGRLESRWDRLTAACAAWPQTLVHADFSRKHVRVRRGDAGVRVLALDWETAGWGPPAADLADVPWGRSRGRVCSAPAGAAEDSVPWYGPVSLDVYASAVARRWPAIRRGDVERLSQVGAAFRIIDATCWASRQVASGGIHKGMGMLRAYADDVAPVIARLSA